MKFSIILLLFLVCSSIMAQDIIDPDKNIQIRWEKKGESLMATVTNQPKDRPMIIIRSLSTIEKPLYNITNVTLSGYNGELHWIQNSTGLEVTVPLNTLGEKSFTLRVSIKRKPNYLPNYVYDNNHYLEGVPIPGYQWASEDAYEAFNDLKYGIRIHWGLYSALGVEASWPYLEMLNEERMAYSDRYKIFNPKYFDADKWMSFFKKNGMKMFAFVTKHHDGFSMFNTKTVVTNRINWTAKGGPKVEPFGHSYDIMETPFKRDILKELCDAAHKQDIKIDLYFSNIDWFNADQRGVDGSSYELGNLSVASDEELKRGMQRHRDQLKELITNYGKIDMICLDMTLKERAWPESRQTMIELRKLQPDVMYRNRNIENYGDYYTPEGWVPGNIEATNMPWFVIYTLSGIFAYDPVADHYRDGSWIVYNVIDATSKGGNFMVSIGPDENGLFHPRAVEAVESAGDWFRINGEAIFATRPWKIFGEGPTATNLESTNKRNIVPYTVRDIRFTRSKDRQTIYAILMGVPDSKSEILINALSKISEPAIEIGKITVLGNEGELKWSRDDNGLRVEIPENLICKYACAIKIALK
jgi:alpha-L-fucosidase